MNNPKIALVAGEVSGDALGAGLIEALRLHYPAAEFRGVTGPRMRAAGCGSLADIEALSLFGVSEVVLQIPRLLRLRRQLLNAFRDWPADVFVGIDAPSFNTGLEWRLRAAGIKTAHYVCPTVWAWRQGRLAKIKRAVDLMLTIFPFEEPFLARHGVPARYVGHPLADAVPLHPDAASARAALGLEAQSDGENNALWLALLPGSRSSELRRLGPAFIDTALWLQARLPGLKLVAPMASATLRAGFEAQLGERAPGLAVHLVDGRSREVLRAADVALTASGTATLEAMLLKTPMVVAYGVSGLNYAIARGLNLIKVAHVSIPNLLADRAVVPELLQQHAIPAELGPAVLALLQSADARQAQVEVFEGLHAALRCNANASAAAGVAGLLEAQ